MGACVRLCACARVRPLGGAVVWSWPRPSSDAGGGGLRLCVCISRLSGCAAKKLAQYSVEDVCSWVMSLSLDPLPFKENAVEGADLLEVRVCVCLSVCAVCLGGRGRTWAGPFSRSD
jgi:hypothetical protein